MIVSVQWPSCSIHMPVISKDWSMGATGGGGVSVGTPEIKVAFDINYLRLPLNRIIHNKVSKTYMLQGNGFGVGVGAGISFSFVNISGSFDSFLGRGSPIWLSPISPLRPLLEDFTKYAYITSLQKTNMMIQGSAAVVFFTNSIVLNPLSITAIGVCVSTSIASSFISVGADIICFNIHSQPFP